MSRNVPLVAVKAITAVWAAFWSFFVVASAFTEPNGNTSPLLVCLLGLAFFLGSGLLVFRFPRIGGPVLFVEGVMLLIANMVFFHNTMETRLFLLFTLALPPLVVGRFLIEGDMQNHPSFR